LKPFFTEGQGLSQRKPWERNMKERLRKAHRVGPGTPKEALLRVKVGGSNALLEQALSAKLKILLPLYTPLQITFLLFNSAKSVYGKR